MPDSENAPSLTGAEALVRTLISGGIDTCFANPGTSEMHFVAALDRIPGIRCVLGLQENTVTGMADGYFRITGRPAATLLHCGPGYANGIANIHNARRAGSGMVNIIGDHAIPHVPFDSPLTSDIAALAGSTSDWFAMSREPASIGADAARAIAAAGSFHGQIASLVLPADVSWSEGGRIASPVAPAPPPAPDPGAVVKAARALRSGKKILVLLGTPAVRADLHPLLAGIAIATGADLMGSSTIASLPRGRGRLNLPLVPYVVPDAVARLAAYDALVLVNCPPPVGFFRYPGQPSLLHRPDAELIVLARPEQDAAAALHALAAEVGAKPTSVPTAAPDEATAFRGAFTPASFARHVARLLPDNAIVVNEALTLGSGFGVAMPTAAPVEWLTVTGGAIGGGPPLAAGAAIGAAMTGHPRPVIALQADGSAAYTMQALWTQARETLPVITLLLNNRSYAILHGEYQKVGASPGPTAHAMMSLDNPPIDWCGLAKALGVGAERVATHEALDGAFLSALEGNMPALIDVSFG